MELNNKKEAVVASLSLSICSNGSLVCDYSSVDIEQLKSIIQKTYPTWESLDDTINAIRWVGDKMKELNENINQEYVDEDIYIQERVV